MDDNKTIAVLASRKDRDFRKEFLGDFLALQEGQYQISCICKKFNFFKQEIDVVTNKIVIWEKIGIRLCLIGDKNYPRGLQNISDPPLVLYYLGNLEHFAGQSESCAIVGARKATPQNCSLARNFAWELAKTRVKVISGLALGVDIAAHQGAVTAGGKAATLAVLGNALPDIYPVANQKTAEDILSSGGAIVSQFEPGTKTYPANFLNRNRLIAGFSGNIIIIQAGERSGSLVTARYALEQGKDVWVIPGDVHQGNFKGSNLLIQQGANVLTGIEDLKFIYPEKFLISRMDDLDLAENLSAAEKAVYSYIRTVGNINILELQDKFIRQGNLVLILQRLTSSNLISIFPGGYYGLKKSIR